MVYSPFELLVTFLSDETCIICGQRGSSLCVSCFNAEVHQKNGRCYICNKLSTRPGICSSCPSKLRRVWWLGTYKEPLKELIWQMKFNRQRVQARLFGKYIAQVLPYLPKDTFVTSVPTAVNRIRRRGFDQAELLARTLAKEHDLQYIKTLYRTSTVDLIGKNRRERLEAMRESMGMYQKAEVQKANVLLIDDVLTTGTTLEVAAQLLRKHGAKHVDAAVIAHQIRK